MELNAEQIKTNIEACIERECENCSYNEQTACKETMLYDTLSLINSQEQRIKELTEENEAWQKALITEKENADKAYYELACEVEDLRAEKERLKARVLEENHLRHQAEEMLAQGMSVVKADTVREMQELLYKDFNTTTKPDMYIKSIIDKRVKEMLEDKQCT